MFWIVAEGDEYDEQIAAGCVGDGLADWQAEAAVLHSRQQPEKVYATSVVRLPSTEELSADRLPRRRVVVTGLSGAG
jgi:hypothetical protein